jgi:hypothetical protein
MDDDDGEDGEENAETKSVETEKGVRGPDNTIFVCVEEVTVLL